MILHRVTTKAYIQDFSGTGAMLYGGRWNHKGTRMVYTSASLSLATLEIVANLSSDRINRGLYCVEINFPDHLEITELTTLPKKWNRYPYTQKTMDKGSQFIKKGGLCLKVPSALVPSEFNYLINPMHDQASQIKFIDARPMILDQRLLKHH
ncbi:MAG: RES family NAD+ phosphorylase [Fulvivirga sp.]|uniref:RES family NAD+ phosphorylase n=1 Tax=Fulvivirga sp. TaxID=1931237 RepID=UPI0032EF873B